MAHVPKLEVYQVWLRPYRKINKTYREFFLETIDDLNSDEDDNSIIFSKYFQDFIHKIDSDEFIEDRKKKKAFAAYDTSPTEAQNSTISFDSDKYIIQGTVEGGRYGQKRNKSSMSNKLQKEDVKSNDIILDKFYFCLYTPLNSDLGILFLQSYSNDTVSDIFSLFISELFFKQGVYRKAKVERFVPKKIVDEFKSNSNIKKFTFSSRFAISQLGNTPTGQNEEEFIIKIEAVSKNGISKNSLVSWVNTLGSKVFNSKKLEEFPEGKVYLVNTQTKKLSHFAIDSNIDIKPIIYLEGRIDVNQEGLPNFVQLKDFCYDLLDNEIIPEMYVLNNVREH